MTRNNADFQTGILNHNSAYVSYTHFPKKNLVRIDYLKSNDEGKGDATEALRGVYHAFPEAMVSHTRFLHPAAEHIARKVANEFGRD